MASSNLVQHVAAFLPSENPIKTTQKDTEVTELGIGPELEGNHRQAPSAMFRSVPIILRGANLLQAGVSNRLTGHSTAGLPEKRQP